MTNLPEAPASANVRVQLPSGRQYQITIRTDKGLLEMIERLEEQLDEKGWKVPDWQQNGTEKPQKDLGNCEKCGAPIKLSKAGKPYCSATCWLK